MEFGLMFTALAKPKNNFLIKKYPFRKNPTNFKTHKPSSNQTVNETGKHDNFIVIY